MLIFDLQLFAEEGVNGEVADPTADSEGIDGGATDTEGTQDIDEGSNGEAGIADQPEEGEERTSRQDPKIDAAFAKLRREKEQYERKVQELESWIQEKFGRYGIKNLDDYIQAVEQELQRQEQLYKQQQEQRLREMGYNPEEIREIMKTDPEFQQMKQQNEQLQRELQQQKAQQRVLQEFNELKEKYPQFVKDPKDIDEKTRERWQRGGVTLLEAFELANKDKILEAAAQRARNQQTNRKHLKAEGDGYSEGADINMPPETLQMYLDMGFTKKQAYEHFRKLYK